MLSLFLFDARTLSPISIPFFFPNGTHSSFQLFLLPLDRIYTVARA